MGEKEGNEADQLSYPFYYSGRTACTGQGPCTISERLVDT